MAMGCVAILLTDLEAECLKDGVISKSKRERDRRELFKNTISELRAAGALIDDGTGRIYPRPAPKRE